jgi:hypothetical protein
MNAGVSVREWAACVMLGLLVAACGNSSAGAPSADGGASSGGASSGGASSGGASSGGASAGGGFAGSVSTAGGSSGGASAGTSGGGSAGGGPFTKYQACVAYLNAQCNRRYFECGGLDARPDPCPEFVASCPDFLFSDGSQMDVPSALACAETWRTYSCDQLNQGLEPKCGPAGTRAVGEPCLYGRQCVSRACGRVNDIDHPDCGVCSSVGVAGDACYMKPIACPDAYECTGSGCQPSVHFNLPDGALCERLGQCAGASLCFPAADGMMRCQAQRKPGEDCSNGAYCEPGTTCGADQRCAVVVLASVGQRCGAGCASDGWCDNTTLGAEQAVCVARADAGAPCQATVDQDPAGTCRSGLSCSCNGSGCTPTCLYQRREGEACGDALSFCVSGTTCEAGKCVGVEQQGLFKAACGP